MTIETPPAVLARLAELLAIAENATEGPWTTDDTLPGRIFSDDATGSIIAQFDGFRFAPRADAEMSANVQLATAAVNFIREHADTLRTSLAQPQGAVACDVVDERGAVIAARVTIEYADELLREYKYSDCRKANLLFTRPAAVDAECSICPNDMLHDGPCNYTPASGPTPEGVDDTARLDFIERTFSGMTNRERYLPVQMTWGSGANGRTLREACDKYMKRDAAFLAANDSRGQMGEGETSNGSR